MSHRILAHSSPGWRPSLAARAVVLALTLALLSASATMGFTTTDQLDYAPGSVVTLSGGNDADGAPGYVPGATVTVDVTGPNGWTAGCVATVLEGATWACTITLDADPAIAVGDYTYTASSTDAAGAPILETGAFSDAAPIPPVITVSADPSTATFGATVALSGSLTKSGAPLASKTITITAYPNAGCTGNSGDTWTATTAANGSWSRSVTVPSEIGVVYYKAAYDAGGSDKDDDCASVSVLRALYVVPNARSIAYGSTAPSTSFYTFTLHADSSTGSVIGSIATMPSCTSAYTSTSPAGSLPITCSGGAGTGYLLFYETATLTIQRAPSVVSVSCTPSVTYTGSPLTPCTATATGVGISPIDLTGSIDYSANTVVGTATATATWAGDANHDGSTGTATFSITRAPSVVSVVCPASVTYTATARTPCTATATGVAMDPVDLTSGAFSYANNVTVGTATASATWPGDANHDGSTGTATFSILPATMVVLVTGGSTRVTSPATASGVTVSVTLNATVGDAATAGLVVTLANVSGGSTIATTCGSASPGSGLTVTRICSVSTSLGIGVYDVVATASGNYSGTGADLHTVYDPSLGFATGGGSTLVAGERMNFGFVMKYNRSGTSLQGGLIAVLHHADGTTSRLRSNALAGLAIEQVGGCGVATFGGKANDTHWDAGTLGYVTSGGMVFTVVATDCTDPGNGSDSIRLNATGTAFAMPAAAMLSAGQIAVPHRAR